MKNMETRQGKRASSMSGNEIPTSCTSVQVDENKLVYNFDADNPWRHRKPTNFQWKEDKNKKTNLRRRNKTTARKKDPIKNLKK